MRAETSATSAITALSVAVAAVGHALAGGSVSLAVLPQLVVLAAIGWSLGEHLTGRRILSITTLATLQLTAHLTLDLTHPASTPAPTPTGHAAMGHAATAMDHAAMGHAPTSMSDAATAAATHHATLAHAATAADQSAAAGHAAMGHGAGEMAGMLHGGGSAVPGAGEAAGGFAAGMHDGVGGAAAMSAAHLLVLLAGVVLVGSTHRWVQRVVRILARLVPHLPEPAVAIPGVRAALPGVPEQPRLTQRWLTSGVSRRGPPQYRVLGALS
ncbi:hypothetical protein [Kribbella sp. CA-294648]|uniref:hypothetical protein n=1 Tax=Kribbella sp. CA-294648 TaxID=3239948 RepID=UPI003D9326FC